MFGLRKVISGTVLLIVGLGVTFIKGDIPSNLLALMQWLYVAFVAGNVGEHVTTMMAGKKSK